jgi:hypothetical protein
MKCVTRLSALAAAIGMFSAVALAQAKVDLTGKWAFTVETSAGGGTPNITLKQDGEKLTGHYSGQLGEADLAGSVKGQDIQSKDSLKGTLNIAGLADGTFTAKREP